MSLHWTLIAGFLYGEVVVVLLFLLPFVSNRAWSKLFKSNFLKGIENQFIYYFYILVAILVLFFLDAIREMQKYSDDPTEGHSHGTHLDAQMQMHMRLFRAQRNFYISGFALFLCLVIRKMVTLMINNAVLEVEREAAMKQAKSASMAAEALLDGASGAADSKAEKALQEKDEELKKALKNVESMKIQSENLAKEYDRLMDEKDKLERKVRILDGGADGDKKSD